MTEQRIKTLRELIAVCQAIEQKYFGQIRNEELSELLDAYEDLAVFWLDSDKDEHG